MAIDQESFNTDLYRLLRTRGYKPVPKDAKNQRTQPEAAEVFNFTFVKDGKDYGDAWVTIDDAQNVIVYYDNEQQESPSGKSPGLDYDDSWSGFLRHLKQWSMNKQLTFELRNKDELGDDMAQRDYVKKKEKMNEGYHAMGKTASYNDNIPAVKIILQHNRKIEEGEQRYRNIAKIFLENQDGERFLAPTTRPGIAQVYARHIAEGGVPNDERWNHIKSLCEEYNKMAGFVRATKNKQFNESAQQLVSEGINHYQSLRETLGKLRGHRGYNMYFESWTPALMEDDTEVDTINELFVQETVDPRIESVMPILSRLHKKDQPVKEVKELEEWADKIAEQDVAEGYDQTVANIKNYERELAKYKRFNANGAHDVKIKNLEKIIANLKKKQEEGVAEGTDNLNYIGNCTDDDVIEHIFGDATGFAQAVEEYGDEFVLDDLVVKYDPETDVHSFYYKKKGVAEGSCEVDEDLDADQKRVRQLGPTEKVGKEGAIGKLVGVSEAVDIEDGSDEPPVNIAYAFIMKNGNFARSSAAVAPIWWSKRSDAERFSRNWGDGKVVKVEIEYDTRSNDTYNGYRIVRVIDESTECGEEMAEGLDVTQPLVKYVMRAWNAGDDNVDRVVNRYNLDRNEAGRIWNELENIYGNKSIPVPDLYGYKSKEPTDPKYRRWKGLDGPGKELRDIIKLSRKDN